MKRWIAASAAVAAASGGMAVPAPASPLTPPRLTANAAVLIEASTGQRLYALAADRELPIASATKLMTALVTLERVRDLSKMFAQNSYYPAAIDSQIGLVPGERMSVRDLLVALMLPSADDAAEDLAFHVGHGSVARFVAMMNARARRLGLVHTHYATPSGLDAAGNYSSAADLVTLARFLLVHHKFFARVVALRTALLRTGTHPRLVANRNDLIGHGGIGGVKTGHTLAAGYVLVASATRARTTLLSAVLGTPSPAARDADTLALISYGFANFRLITPVRAGEVLARPSVRYRSYRAQLIAGRTLTRVVARSASVTTQVQAPRRLAGPLKKNAHEGQVVVLLNGHPIERIPLLLARALPAVSAVTLVGHFLTQPSTLLSLAALLIAAAGLILVRRGRARGRESASLEAA